MTLSHGKTRIKRPFIEKILTSECTLLQMNLKNSEEKNMSLFDKHTCARFAKTFTAMCVRNAEIENIHAGARMITKTGDYSDIKVIDAEGNEFS